MNSNYIMSISFAKYVKEKSGMAKVHLEHQKMFNKQGISYVHLFTVKKLLFYDRLTAFCVYGMYIDGEYTGMYTIDQVIEKILTWKREGKRLLDFHIHHLLYIKLKQINKLLSYFGHVPIKVYLHDYYLMCVNYTLMRNGEEFCGSNGFDQIICKNCSFYRKSRKRVPELKRLLASFEMRIIFVSPSKATKDIFCTAYPQFRDQTLVINHQCYDTTYKGNREHINASQKVRVAFLGVSSIHKGWKIWESLVHNSDPSEYDFYVFNSSDDSYPGMKKVKTGYASENLNAMTDALRKIKVHIVVLWSLWPETYSYTCFEAFSANAFLLTSQMSGNIADTVENYNCGAVLNNENDLYCLFQNPSKLKKMINSHREKTASGPYVLYENNEIVKLSQKTFETDKEVNVGTRKKIINLPLVWFLNVLYRTGKL